MNPFTPPTQALIDGLYQNVMPQLEPHVQQLLRDICEGMRQNDAGSLLGELYRRFVPFLTPTMRQLLQQVCDANARLGGGVPGVSPAALPPGQSPQTPPPPTDCANPVWTGTGWSCPATPPGKPGGGCGCGGHKPQPPAPQIPPPPQYPPPNGGGQLPPSPAIPKFSNGALCPAPAVSPTPMTSPATNPYVNANGMINCQWYDQSLTLCEIRKIKEEQTQNVFELDAQLTDPGVYETDIPAALIANGLCTTSLRVRAIDLSADYTDLVSKVEMLQVKMVQSPEGESLLVYGMQKGASGVKLKVTDGRCECVDLCVCQIATLPVRIRVYVLIDGNPATVRVDLDYERIWADDACMQCMPCGIPQQCGEELYEPLA